MIGRERLDRLGDRHVDVRLRERLARGGEDADRIGCRGLGALEAARVRDEDGVSDARPAIEARHELVRVGQLRDRPGRDEAGGLDLAQPGIGEELDEAQLRVGADRGGLVLEAVAGANLVDPDVAVAHDRSPVCGSVVSATTASRSPR